MDIIKETETKALGLTTMHIFSTISVVCEKKYELFQAHQNKLSFPLFLEECLTVYYTHSLHQLHDFKKFSIHSIKHLK